MLLRLTATSAMLLFCIVALGQIQFGGIAVGVPYQGYSPYPQNNPYQVYNPYQGYSPYRGFPNRSGSTVAESQMRGMADLTRASGYRNLLNSEAAINLEEARSRQLDNRVKFAETYYEKRRLREQAKNANRQQMTAEKAHRMADMARPKRLSSEEYSPDTGTITWPIALRGAIMNGTRKRIEQLMAERDISGHLEADSYYEVVRMCEFLDQQVTKEIGNIPMQDVSKAKAFIKRLAYEARIATG